MAQLNVNNTRDLLQSFDFQRLFLQELGWEKPSDPAPRSWTVVGRDLQGREIASLAGVSVLEITSVDGEIPDSRTRLSVWREIARAYHENLLIFVDGQRRQSLWYWVKRGEKGKVHPRDHYFYRGQPGDLFLSKLASLVIDVAELDEAARPNVLDIAQRLRNALDIERVTKRFYNRFREERDRFFDLIEGIDDERQREWYTSVLLNRLMFVYFLQRKGFLNKGEVQYLQKKLAECQAGGPDRFYSFLKRLFFEGFAKPDEERSLEVRSLLGDIRYLDGGLFLPHKVEIDNPNIRIPDAAFESILNLFASYSWNLNDSPGGNDDEINPDVLGYIFEKYINQKAFGAYYTRPEITRYLCEQTIHPLILSRVQESPGFSDRFESFQDLLLRLDARLCQRLLDEILPSLSILDPACGSGAFLVAALKVLIDVYSVVIGKAKFTSNRYLQDKIREAERKHPSLYYWIKKLIITDNLFGVDIMEEATEITKLRLFLALVASASRVEDLEPLPNIDFNILAGNSLIGLLHVQAEDFDSRQRQGNLFRRTFQQVLDDKNRLIDHYRHAVSHSDRLQAVRDEIDKEKEEANATLNEMLLAEFADRGIKFEEVTWDVRAGKQGKPKKRPVTFEDVEDLRPFHWGYEFDQALQGGGFDVILTNPPWEVFKPQAKEFFSEYSGIVKKNKMTIKDFEREQGRLLRNPEIRKAWFEYQRKFPHQSALFRASPQYENQISVIDGRKAGTDINLYKLFLERCFRLLRTGGRCGILLPTSIYSDLGSKRLREMLLANTCLEKLFGLSNERFVFEGVDHRFRFCLMVFEKGTSTRSFEAAFRINPREAISADRLESFLYDRAGHLIISSELIHRLSPDSLSILEFKSDLDIRIAERMAGFPMLGRKFEDFGEVTLGNEFHMTNDSHLFETASGPGKLPLIEGKMIHQFVHEFSGPRYWIDEERGRRAILGRKEDEGAILDYQDYRLGFRRIGRDSDERTMIATVIPPGCFASESLNVSVGRTLEYSELLILVAILNSLVLDYVLRMRVSANINMFHAYQLPIPRIGKGCQAFIPIVSRAGRLVCTASEFSRLWEEVMHQKWEQDLMALNPGDRTRLRAELDGLIAHLYGLPDVTAHPKP